MGSTTDIHLAMINVQTNQEHAKTMNLSYINLKPAFQRDYESWDEKMKTRFIESILLGRAMNPIWTVENSDELTLEVLDGMHRLTTALRFLSNDFALGVSLATLDSTIYKGKKFADLSEEDKNKIRNYKFTFNHLDSSYRNDTDKLMDMYEILNASSKPLNKHEYRKPIYRTFYDLISYNQERWFKTPIFDKSKVTRGDLSTLLTKILALSEERIPTSFSSINDIATKWEESNLGSSNITVRECLSTHGNTYKERLDKFKKYMDKFISDGLFPESKSEDPVVTLIVIARTVALVKKDNLFSRHIDNLIAKFKQEIFEGSIQEKLECKARNAVFQNKLISKIDTIIMTEIGEVQEPRLFTKSVIDAKLVEQEGKCAMCKLTITKQQKYEGDHTLPWGQGGRTIPENCQVVHQKCHKKKC